MAITFSGKGMRSISRGESSRGKIAGEGGACALFVAVVLAMGSACAREEVDPVHNRWIHFSVLDQARQMETFLYVDQDGFVDVGRGRPARPGEAPVASPLTDEISCLLVMTEQREGSLSEEDRSWLESRLGAQDLDALRPEAIPWEGRSETCPELPNRFHLCVYSIDGGEFFFEDFDRDGALSDDAIELLHRLQAITESFFPRTSFGIDAYRPQP